MQAKHARELYEMIGQPSYNKFVAIIKNNLLLHSKTRTQDVLCAEAIFGKDLGTLQGKTVRRHPDPVIADYIKVPKDIMKHHSNVIMAVDIMTIGGVPFLITTSRDIQFTTVEKIDSKMSESLKKGIIKVINLYRKRGFVIDVCLGDNEFECVRSILQEHTIQLNICAPGVHVLEVERKIRTIKEQVRVIITTLPFKIIPIIIITHATIFSTMWINFFPPKGGVSQTLSPQAIVTGLYPDADKHCRILFGGYAQVHAKPHPSNDAMVSRTVGGIALGPTGNIQGTHKLLSLLTGKLIKARSCMPLPMPHDVIAIVEGMRTPDPIKFNPDQQQEQFITSNINLPVLDDVSLEADSEISVDEIAELLDNTMNQHYELAVNISPSQETEASIDHKNDGSPALVEPYDQPATTDVEENENTRDKELDNSQEIVDSDIDKSDEMKVEGVSPRTHYITQSGRHVRTRKDLYQGYDFTQIKDYSWNNEDVEETIKSSFSPNSQTPSVQNKFVIKPMDQVPRFESISNDAMIHCAFTQHSLKQGLKTFPEEARDATIAEIQQLHDMSVFQPVHKSSLTQQEIQGVLNSITFIKQK
jgi:hypothetical protein